ncbi:MAG: hypothetical protein QXL96_06815 [Ignisphaera sp.]
MQIVALLSPLTYAVGLGSRYLMSTTILRNTYTWLTPTIELAILITLSTVSC